MKKTVLIVCIQMIGSITFASSNEINHLQTYMWANYQHYNNSSDAGKWYESLMAGNPCIYAYKGYLYFLFQTQQFEKITSLLSIVDDAFAHDQELQLLVAHSLQLAGNMTAAHERFIQLNHQFNNNPDISYQTATLYVRSKEYTQALNVIDNYIQSNTNKKTHFAFYFLESNIHRLLGDNAKALTSVKKSIEIHPHFDKGWLVAAALQEQAGNLEEAITGYTHFLSLTTEKHPEIEKLVAQLSFQYKTKGHMPNHQLQHYAQAVNFFEHKEYAHALAQIDLHLEKRPTDLNARMFKIQLLVDMRALDTAASLLGVWIMEEPDNDLWYQTIHLLHRAGLSHAKTIITIKQIAKKYPTKLLPALYIADLYTRADDYQEAIKWHRRAYKLTDDTMVKAKINFHLSLLHYEHDKVALAIQELEADIDRTQFAPSRNLLAYCYAQTNTHIARAHELIHSALSLDPENPHYLDTKAFILYQQGNYEQALVLLESIAPQLPNDTHVLQHLIATHQKMGMDNQLLTSNKITHDT